MKLVMTPRPEKKLWKSIVGPWMAALRPPAHSTWATLRPARSADWAIDSAWRTPGSNAAVRAVPNASPFLWNVLLVDPWTPGHAPVARVYQPAPVFGGACVSRPLPDALLPDLRNPAIVGITPAAAYCSTMSWRMPSAAKNTALPGVFPPLPGGGAADAGAPMLAASKAATASRSVNLTGLDRGTALPLHRSE